MVWAWILRSIIGIICIISLTIMIRSYFRERKDWNEKTLDYWYSRVMWSVSGLSACVEGIVRGLPIRYSFVFVIAATVITLKGNLRKGKWGGDQE